MKKYTAYLGTEKVELEELEAPDKLWCDDLKLVLLRRWLTNVQEVEEEVDWSKVERGAKVIVNCWNSFSEPNSWEEAEFIAYEPRDKMPFIVWLGDGTAHKTHCKLASPDKSEPTTREEYWCIDKPAIEKFSVKQSFVFTHHTVVQLKVILDDLGNIKSVEVV